MYFASTPLLYIVYSRLKTGNRDETVLWFNRVITWYSYYFYLAQLHPSETQSSGEDEDCDELVLKVPMTSDE